MADVDLALDYIDSMANDWTIASGHYGLSGASAGGHISLLYAYAFDNDNRIKAVSSLAGPTDLSDSLFIEYATNHNLDYVFSELIDADYTQNEALLAAASPITHLTNLPTQLQHGEEDDLVPFEQSQSLADALNAQAYTVELIAYPNTGHNILGQLGGNTGAIINSLSDWFSTHL